jgi:hypothetical protein
LLKNAADQEPSFATVGGDLAYANDVLTNYTRWDAWLQACQKFMVTPKGFTIPMVLAIGNHDVRGGSGHSPTDAQFYFRYFAQEEKRSYYSRRFGKNLVIYLRDSGHISRHAPQQSQWLEEQMEGDREFPVRFAIYHVPLYPTFRADSGAGSVAGRDAWVQIFDKHRLTAAFEHHDHVFKRIKSLREYRPDPNGTLYLGDGCWEMPARPLVNQPAWYHEKAASLQHFWRVDESKNRVEYSAISKEGQVFDVYPPDTKGAKDAENVIASLINPPKATSPSAIKK